ncbi:MAG: glycosyltransferase [Chloroflexaceae bacterium]|nr:glycosyltransferase [Chloroflexaceae bacterium]
MAIAERPRDTLEGLEFGPRIVVVIPAYNEERFIGSTVIQAMKFAYRVIVVDDGSKDATVEVAKLAGALVVRHEKNQGKGVALTTGFKKARLFAPDVVVTLDADGQHLPTEMMRVAAPIIENTADIVIGSRYIEQNSEVPVHRVLGHRVFNLLTNQSSGMSTTDSQSGFRAFSGAMLESLSFQSRSFSVECEMQFIAQDKGLRVAEVPITILYNDKPKRPVVQHGFIVLDGLLRLIGQYRPLLFFGGPGLAVVAMGLLLAAWVSYIYATAQELAVGYALIVVMLVIVGSLLSFTGVLLHSMRGLILGLKGQEEAANATERETSRPGGTRPGGKGKGGDREQDKVSYALMRRMGTTAVPSSPDSMHSADWSMDDSMDSIRSTDSTDPIYSADSIASTDSTDSTDLTNGDSGHAAWMRDYLERHSTMMSRSSPPSEELSLNTLVLLGERWHVPDRLYQQVGQRASAPQPSGTRESHGHPRPTREPAKVRASVVMVNYNSGTLLRQGIESVLRTAHPDDELVVVDNASTDGSIDAITQDFEGVRIVRSETNLGFGGGNNLGAQHARGEYLAFLNPDTRVEPGWLDTLIDCLEANPQAGLATPRILLLDAPDTINTCGNDMHYTGLTLCRGMGAPADAYLTPEEVSAVSGAAFVMRKGLFHTLGGFDEAFFLYMEDTDLSLRTRIAGYQCLYVPTSVVYHDYRLRFGPRKTYYQEHGRYRLLLKSLEWRTLLLLAPALLLAEIVTWGFVLTRDKLRLTNKLRAYASVMRNFRTIMRQRQQVQSLRRVQDYDIIKGCSASLAFGQTGAGWVALLASRVFNPWFAIWKESLHLTLKQRPWMCRIQEG